MSDSPSDTVYPIVECPVGPHDTVAFLVPTSDGQIGVVMCPVHHKILNLHTRITFKEWLSESELQERGYRKLA